MSPYNIIVTFSNADTSKLVSFVSLGSCSSRLYVYLKVFYFTWFRGNSSWWNPGQLPLFAICKWLLWCWILWNWSCSLSWIINDSIFQNELGNLLIYSSLYFSITISAHQYNSLYTHEEKKYVWLSMVEAKCINCFLIPKMLRTSWKQVCPTEDVFLYTGSL